MRVLVYDEDRNTMETYERKACENMPYTTKGRLTAGNFRRGIKTSVVWTTKRFLQAWEQLHASFGNPCLKGVESFRRGWMNTEDQLMLHQRGTAIDTAINLSAPEMQRLATMAEDMDVFDYISELDPFPTYMHFHQQANQVASDLVPYPQIELGSKGTEVCIAQDVLWFLGYDITKISGIFDQELQRAVKRYQQDVNLVADGIIGKLTWESLMNEVTDVPGLE